MNQGTFSLAIGELIGAATFSMSLFFNICDTAMGWH
jgi:hypothetical protein